ncbi:OX-2 membrane glycoprotein-like [Acanthopagrus latus]|uniref:OX-2 membrane glycoprotein-like n=1 Tax=Acanthopagrus latus TaxID=8177 RepID=UPI00187CC817|nr:OX-2 membrane glycoprotein-like [Acanthopagrus latus]
MLLLLLCTALFLKASVSQLTGYGNVTAVYGGDVEYGCTLANPAGVLQVTWQRLFKDDSIENLATYSKRFGQQVNEPYQGKVMFTEASLHSTSISLRNVTWEDESCYICSFNAYPEGSKRKQTCLKVQGISEVRTSERALSGEHEGGGMKKVVFSCSATGKPAPTIKWDLSDKSASLAHQCEATVTNSDHTATRSCNITVEVPAGWSGHVDWQLNVGMAGQRSVRIPFSLGSIPPNQEDPGLSSSGLAFVVCALLFVLLVAVAAALKLKKQKKSSSRHEGVC